MESNKKLVLTLLIGFVFCGYSLAYDSSLTNSSIDYTYDEIPDRLNDNLIKTNNSVKDGFGGIVSKYIILILLFVIIAILIKTFKGWLL